MKTNVNNLMEEMRNKPFPEAVENDKELKEDKDWNEWLLDETKSHERGQEAPKSFYDRKREKEEAEASSVDNSNENAETDNGEG